MLSDVKKLRVALRFYSLKNDYRRSRCSAVRVADKLLRGSIDGCFVSCLYIQAFVLQSGDLRCLFKTCKIDLCCVTSSYIWTSCICGMFASQRWCLHAASGLQEKEQQTTVEAIAFATIYSIRMCVCVCVCWHW